jgi:hypothetical protein
MWQVGDRGYAVGVVQCRHISRSKDQAFPYMEMLDG